MPFILILLLAFSLYAGVAQTETLNSQSIERQALGSPDFTDNTAYNSYDFSNSPLGLFERESCDVRVSLAYRSLSLQHSTASDSFSRTANSFNIPDILIGKRNLMYVMLNYSPVTIEQKTVNEKITIPVNRVGLTFGAQTPGKLFRFGLSAQAYLGNEKTSRSDSTRMLMGLSTIQVFLGSQVHPLVRLGVHGGGSGNLDSLQDPSHQAEDRYFYGTIPSLGADVNFGAENFPVQSNFVINKATNHLVYVTKGLLLQKPEGNEDALVADSLFWKWEVMGLLSNSGITYQPACMLSYMGSRVQQYAPDKSNYPLTYGNVRQDTSWGISAFTFGIGASAIILEYGKAWFEYSQEFFDVKYGAALALSDTSRSYNRFGLGVEGNIHAISALRIPSSIEVYLRAGYCTMKTDGRFGTYDAEEFRLINNVGAGSLRYGNNSPYRVTISKDEILDKFTLGLGSTFFTKTLGVQCAMGFLTKRNAFKQSGFEFSGRVDYALWSAKK